jgi:S1-C subfamily serine protease
MRRSIEVCFCLAIVSSAAFARNPAGLERSVVRIVNYSQRGDWSSPWNASKVTEVAGSGFVIKGGLVMTNAHVVSDSRRLLMYFENDPTPHEAEVLHVGHDCDLALVRARDPHALKGTASLSFGGLPLLGSAVETLGYPIGGIRVSSARGVVSRVEEQMYVHSGIDGHLAVQTDATINPGSSGGPVIQSGRVVGVAFQTSIDLQGVGYFIPIEVIDRFLRDVEDGRYDGYPDLGAGWANMEPAAARVRAGMADIETGVRITRVMRGSSADGRIQVGDVVLAVNGRPVANDGSVADGKGRIPFGLLIDRMFIGEAASVRVLRDGKRLELAVPLVRQSFGESRRNAYDQTPRYFIYGGLVFVPLCRETLKTYGDDWSRDAPSTLLDEYFNRVLEEPNLQLHERVVLLRRLDDPVNAEMAWYLDQVVERVNGRAVTGLPSLIDAFEQFQGEFQLIEFAHVQRFGVLDREKAEAANERILDRYGIQKDRAP